MLTRLVRIQLIIFTVAAVVGSAVMIVKYLQLPTLLGIGRITVTMDLPAAGGLYRFANVTYRGIQVGKVTELDVNRNGAVATLSLATSPPIPADVEAAVRSVSAVGEQYVDLLPRTAAAPYLHDGSVIDRDNTTVPQPVGPMMDQLSALIGSVPKDKLNHLIDESFQAFNGAAPDLRSLMDSSGRLSADFNDAAGQAGTLVDDAAPFLDAQEQSADSLRSWSHHLAGVTDQLVSDDPQIRALLRDGPETTRTVTKLLDQLKPTLPVLMANMSTLGQVAVTYRPALEQVLVLLPPLVSYYQASNGSQNATGMPVGDFRISVSDPPACTVGFLPPSSWRSPSETNTVDTPDGLYCKLPQDSPIAVRGARNYPCMGVPGKYAPTVQECYSDKPYTALAMRQHALGPYPLDPNLIAQGIPPDDRVTANDRIFAPVQGTPMPPPVAGPDAPPPMAVAHYDPATGQFATPDGHVSTQTDLAAPVPPGDWKRLLLPPGVG